MSTLIDLSFLYIKLEDPDGDRYNLGIKSQYTGQVQNGLDFVEKVHQITQVVSFIDDTVGTADTVGLQLHGFTAGDQISFATINNVTGISTNILYTVVLISDPNGPPGSTHPDIFKLSLGGTAVNFTGSGTGTISKRSDSGFFNVGSGLFTRLGGGGTPYGLQLIDIPFANVDFQITYNSGIAALPNIAKNVGRYDYTIRTTLKNNPACKGFFTTEQYVSIPSDLPPWYGKSYQGGGYGEEQVEALKDVSKFLIITPRAISIVFNKLERVYNGYSELPVYTTTPKVLDPEDPNYGNDINLRLTFSGEKALAALAGPIEIGEYTIDAICPEFNYTGSTTVTYIIRPLTNIEAQIAQNEYNQKAAVFKEATSDTGSGAVYSGGSVIGIGSSSALSNSSYASSTNKMTKDEFIQTGILSIMDTVDIEGTGIGSGLATVQTIAECAKNLPQKLIAFAVAKIAMFVLSYIPGLGIINLLTKVLEIIQKVQDILALIEFVKENPWAFANMVLEASGAYAKIGSIANEQFAKIQENFPEIAGEAGQLVKDVAGGIVDMCNMLDSYGNPISSIVKADNTKTPEAVLGFVPATLKQPSVAKGKYDLFQYKLRDALFKDSDKISTLKEENNSAGIQEYVSMLTAIHELAYNYHDNITSLGSATGVLSTSASNKLDSAYNILSSATSILSSVTPQNSTSTPSTTTTSSGSTKKSAFSVDSLNSSLNSVSSALGGVSSGLGAISNFVSGNTGYSLTGFKNEFNYAANEMLKKNPQWSKDTIKEFNARVKRIKKEMESNADVIVNNPTNAKVTAAGVGSSTSGSSSSASLGGSPLFGSISSSVGKLLS